MIKLLKGKRKIVYVILAIMLVLVTWYSLKEKGITATASDSEVALAAEEVEGEEELSSEETASSDSEITSSSELSDEESSESTTNSDVVEETAETSNSSELLGATAEETTSDTATDEDASEDAIATVSDDDTITTEEYSDDGIMLAAGRPSDQSTTGEINPSKYNSSAKVYWDTMTATTTTSWNGTTTTTYSGTGTGTGVEKVTLGTSSTGKIEVTKANSNSSSWSGGKTLETYFPNASAGSSSSDYSKAETGTLTITPSDGYYVTLVVVACCATGNDPYSCQTWSNDKEYIQTFTYTASGTVEVSISSSAFSHSSGDDNYFILIQVAPIPSPLYVEYSYGDIITLMGDDYNSSTSKFASSDSWTDTTDGNAYGTGSVQTDDTQYIYSYNSTGLTDAQKAAEAAKWKHYANTVTDDAKQEAWKSGYYFAGWKAYYYTAVTVTTGDTTNEYIYANNYDYAFSTLYGTVDYDEDDQVTLTTNVLLVAQWTPIETTSITKVWNDEDYESNRPASITANLIGTVTSTETLEDETTITTTETVVINGELGTNSADTLILNSDNNWTQTEIKAPVYYWDGKTEINYELSEDSVTGYVTTISGSVSEGYTITNTYVPSTAITIKKLDKVDNTITLGGVSFTLSKEDGTTLHFANNSGMYQLDSTSESTSTTVTTNSEGLIVINGLTVGTYILTETNTLTGYDSTSLPSVTINVYEDIEGILKVSVSGSYTTSYTVDESDGTLIIYNTPLYSTLTINKINIAETGLEGVKFTIQEIGENGEAVGDTTEVTTNENGTINFSSRYGKSYIITEVETLDGYYLLDSPIYVKVDNSGNWSLYTIGEDGNWVQYVQEDDDEIYEYVSLSGENLTVINQAHSELPKAGGIGTHGFYILGISIMTLCLGIRIYLKKSKKI